ncbi:MAG: metallopeptidase family protein [Candidatus Saccharimonas sp.]
MNITDEAFERMINMAMNELPKQHISNLNNVAITFADEPTAEQLKKQGVRQGQLLLGLYEGIPQTQRGAGYQLVLPDKITLFKQPLCRISSDHAVLHENIKRTLWHEIAHHYGLSHDDIDKIER